MHYIEIDTVSSTGKTEKNYICVEHITRIIEDANNTIIYTFDGQFCVNGFVASELIKICVRSTEGNVICFATKN